MRCEKGQSPRSLLGLPEPDFAFPKASRPEDAVACGAIAADDATPLLVDHKLTNFERGIELLLRNEEAKRASRSWCGGRDALTDTESPRLAAARTGATDLVIAGAVLETTTRTALLRLLQEVWKKLLAVKEIVVEKEKFKCGAAALRAELLQEVYMIDGVGKGWYKNMFVCVGCSRSSRGGGD